MTIQVRKIICHYDNPTKFVEQTFSYNQTMDLPYAAGKLQELFPKPDRLEDAREVNQSLFNQSGLGNIVVNVGPHGIYFLVLRKGFVLSKMLIEPESVIADIFFGKDGELIYSFYNPTNKPVINIKALHAADTEDVHGKLKAEPDDLIWRQYFIRKSLIRYEENITLPNKVFPEIMTAEQAADYLQVEVKTIRNWTSDNKIPSVKIAGAVRYKKEEIDAELKRKKKR